MRLLSLLFACGIASPAVAPSCSDNFYRKVERSCARMNPFSNHDIITGKKTVCDDRCGKGMMKCVNNRKFKHKAGMAVVREVRGWIKECHGKKSKHSCGDNICNIIDLQRYANNPSQRQAANFCSSCLYKELLDCQNNPKMQASGKKAAQNAIKTCQTPVKNAPKSKHSCGDNICNIIDLQRYANNPSQTQAANICSSCLYKELLDCQNNPKMQASGKKDAQNLIKLCHTPVKNAQKQAGDKKCQAGNLVPMEKAFKKAHPGRTDTRKGGLFACESEYMQELIDCTYSKWIKGQTRRWVIARGKLCSTKHINAKAGDGECDIWHLSSLDKNDITCHSEFMQEAFDCVDRPELADMKATVLQFQKFCKTMDAKDKNDCHLKIYGSRKGFVNKATSVMSWWLPKGVCCPPGDKCNRVNKGAHIRTMPATCTADCSKKWDPFVRECGPWLEEMSKLHSEFFVHEDDLRKFSAQCLVASDHLGSGH